MKSTNKTWWEKTVEYAFILNNIDKYTFVSPLAGPAETALSDSVFGDEDRLLLIEFKRDYAAINDEKKKYDCYSTARNSLKGTTNVHFVVYGKLEHDSLALMTCEYFEKDKLVNDVLSLGLNQADFNQYCLSLLAHRKADERCSCAFDLSGLSNVVAVDPVGNAVATTLGQYVQAVFPAAKPESGPESGPGPSPRM